MRFLILQLVAIFGLASVLLADGAITVSLTTKEQAEVKQKLEAFVTGKIGLDEASGLPDSCDKVVGYYVLHTNDVSVKMKLPICRSFAMLGKYPEAAKLAQEYVNVYSNDWHGWRVLGGANMAMQLYDQAVSAYTNAARLGDEDIYATLGAAAWAADRLDILQNTVVPRLLVSKEDVARFSAKKRLEMRMILAGYALRVDNQDIFIKAFDGADFQEVLNRDDLKQLVTAGCERFKGEDIDKIRQKFGITKENNSKTNAVSRPSP
jgi:tetratricopeptide (TPR) repeat protein